MKRYFTNLLPRGYIQENLWTFIIINKD